MKNNKIVDVNTFVKRQTAENMKTFTKDLSFDQIAQHAEDQYLKGNFRKGYRKGVIIIDVLEDFIHHFKCPFTKITDNTKLKAQVTRRRINESPYIQLRASNGKLLETGSVELILYSHDILLENNEQSTDAEWELISFHAIPKGIKKMPMGPVTMMRNQLELEGGTKGYYKSEHWAESVRFWQEYAVLDTNYHT